MRILTDQEVIATFGDPTPYILDDGAVSIKWEEKILTYANLPAPLPLSWDRKKKVTRFKCHYKVKEAFEKIFAEICKIPEAWASINDFGGCYNWRAQRRTRGTELSRHAWGIAIDLDVADNPFGRAPQANPHTLRIFHDNGFYWGGNFPTRRRDGMHFEPSDQWLTR